MKPSKHKDPWMQIKCDVIEILSASAGDIGGEPVVILTVRICPDEWQSVNLAITKEQAKRLQQDLRSLFRHSDSLRGKN